MVEHRKVVVFDLGKVLVDFDYTITVSQVLAKSEKGAEAVLKLIDQSPLLHEYESGELDTEEFYQAVVEGAGYSGNREEFERAFAGIFTPIVSMIKFFNELIELGVPIYILSNTNDLAIRYVETIFPEINNATGRIYSWLERSMKPAPEIYRAAERLTEATESQIIFADDKLENIEAAKSRGWNVIHHTDPQVTIAEIKNWLGRS